MDIVAKPVGTAEETKKANYLLAMVQADQEYPGEGAMRWLESTGVSYPGFKQEHTRIAVLGREVVGGLRLNTDTIRIGEARLKMGGIGWVSTASHHRGKGICRLLMEDVVQYMADHNYHVSMLFGIPDFYHRWGYVTTLADHAVVVDTDEACTFPAELRSRKVKPGDIAALQKLHNAGDGGVACSLLRSRAHFLCQWDKFGATEVLLDEQGKVLASYTPEIRRDHLRIREVNVAERGLCAAVVGAAGRIAEANALGHIRFCVPPSHAMARYMLQFKSRHETTISRNAEGMMAFISVGETLESMIPEWESILARSGAADWRAEFTMFVDDKPFRIRANRGAVDVTPAVGRNKFRVSADDLMHLITGYRHAEDILAPGWNLVAADAKMLFTTLFPKRCPFVWPLDRF